MSQEKHRVRTSEVLVINDGGVLDTNSVGSCIVVVLFDKYAKVAGMTHSMLSDRRDNDCSSGGRYVDCGINLVIDEMVKMGAEERRIKAKVIGGASMFTIFQENQIGKDNIQKSKEVLEEKDIEVVAEDVGGQHGRMVSFNTEDFSVKVKSVIGEKVI